MKNINKLILISLLALTVFLINSKIVNAKSHKNKTILIHVVSDIKKDDGPPCVAFDMALTYLKLGYKVEMLYDAEAAWNLKISGKDRKNDLDRYIIPADLKKLIVDQLKDKNVNQLVNFGDFLSYMSKHGVKIYINGTWNVLTSVEKLLKGKVNMPKYAIPITLKEMAKVFNNANTYMRY